MTLPAVDAVMLLVGIDNWAWVDEFITSSSSNSPRNHTIDRQSFRLWSQWPNPDLPKLIGTFYSASFQGKLTLQQQAIRKWNIEMPTVLPSACRFLRVICIVSENTNRHQFIPQTLIGSAEVWISVGELKNQSSKIANANAKSLKTLSRCNAPSPEKLLIFSYVWEKFVAALNNNHNHELCSAPFIIRPTDQQCITVQ